MFPIYLDEPALDVIGRALDRFITAEYVERERATSRFDVAICDAAIRQATQARHLILEAIETPDYPPDMTMAALDNATLWHEYLDR
jgi:hypothetical protein